MTGDERVADPAVMAAGAGLSAVLHATPFDAIPNDRMLEVLRAQRRQLSHEEARMALLMVELARCTDASVPGAVIRRDQPDPWAPHETRAALCWTRSAAEAEHAFVEFIVGSCPGVFDAWYAGSIDRPRVRVFEQYLVGLTSDRIDAVCAVAVPRAPGLTTGQLAALLRRLVISVDPDAAARWYRQRLRDRRVVAYLTADGTVTITAEGLPPDEAEAACRRVERLASTAKRAGSPAGVDQLRADVFLGLLDGRFHGLDDDGIVATLLGGDGPSGSPEPDGPDPGGPQPDVPAPRGPRAGPPSDQRRGIEIRVALSTLLGRDDDPGEIPGLGPVLAPIARARVALQTRAEWRFAVIGPDGALLSEGLTRLRPTGATRTGSPPGGVVEIHVPLDLLTELAADPGRAGAWAAVVTDIDTQHRRNDQHLVDLDARPGDRFPSTALRRHTEIRDRSCTYPGCRRPAHRCAQDHHRDHARRGATTRTNLGPVCHHDHALKHQAGWEVGSDEPGVTTWHSPLGGRYDVRGEFLGAGGPAPRPRPAGFRPWGTENVVEGPILRRPPPGFCHPFPHRADPATDPEEQEPPF